MEYTERERDKDRIRSTNMILKCKKTVFFAYIKNPKNLVSIFLSFLKLIKTINIKIFN